MGKLNGEWLSYYKKNVLHVKGVYEEDLKTGEWQRYTEKGKLQEIGSYKIISYKKHVKYGPFSKRSMKESVKDGHWIWFSDKDGKMTHEGDYKNGKEEGAWIYYYPGGAKANRVIHYKDGRLDGKMLIYQWRPHRVTQEISYKDGLKHGDMFIFDKRGKPVVKKTFEEGSEVRPDGKGKTFKP